MIAFYLFGDFRFQPWLKIIVAVPFETCSWLKNKKSGSGVVRVTDGTESYKKVITLLLVAVLSWICVASGVCAAEEKQPTIQVENTSAAAGETAEVKISIKNNPGILGAKLTLSFAEGLKLISAESGEAFSALTMTKPGELVSPCNFMWDGQELEESDIKDGTILTLKFLVEEAVPRGTKLAVSFSNEGKSVVDGALKPIPLQINNGNVTVSSTENMAVEVSNAAYKEDAVYFTIQSVSNVGECSALLASYDSNGRMRGVEKRSVQISKGESTHSIPCAASSGGYKLFLLKDGSEPVCVATAIDPFAKIFSVTFVDWNGAVVSKQQVSAGDSAAPPPAPKRDGYFFVGWDREFSKINSDCIIAAQYKANVTPTLCVSSVSATAGAKNVAVRISVRNNPGILGLKIRLSYNDDALTLTKAVSGEAFDNYLTMTPPRKFTSGCNLLWDGVEIQTEDVRDGDIVTLWTHS